MKIHLLSDLHFEFYQRPDQVALLNKLIQPADILILAGDISAGFSNVDHIVSQFASHYEHILFVPGNHEFYKNHITEFNHVPFSAKNAHILNPGIFKFQGITFIGASLWTNFRNDPLAHFHAARGINDFRLIQNFSTRDCAKLYTKDIAFIKHQYEVNPGKKVIITHFLPATKCVHPKYQNYDLLNYYFANDLDDYIEHLTDVTWLFGHTHDPIDVVIGETRLLANPYGYPNERKEYQPLILEL